MFAIGTAKFSAIHVYTQTKRYATMMRRDSRNTIKSETAVLISLSPQSISIITVGSKEAIKSAYSSAKLFWQKGNNNPLVIKLILRNLSSQSKNPKNSTFVLKLESIESKLILWSCIKLFSIYPKINPEYLPIKGDVLPINKEIEALSLRCTCNGKAKFSCYIKSPNKKNIFLNYSIKNQNKTNNKCDEFANGVHCNLLILKNKIKFTLNLEQTEKDSDQNLNLHPKFKLAIDTSKEIIIIKKINNKNNNQLELIIDRPFRMKKFILTFENKNITNLVYKCFLQFSSRYWNNVPELPIPELNPIPKETNELFFFQETAISSYKGDETEIDFSISSDSDDDDDDDDDDDYDDFDDDDESNSRKRRKYKGDFKQNKKRRRNNKRGSSKKNRRKRKKRRRRKRRKDKFLEKDLENRRMNQSRRKNRKQNLWKKKSNEKLEINEIKEELKKEHLIIQEHTDPSVFISALPLSTKIKSVQNKLFRAPIAQHEAPETDFIVCRAFDGAFYIREIPAIYTVGKTQALQEVYGPKSKKTKKMQELRLKVFLYRFLKKNNLRSIRARQVQEMHPLLSDTFIRKSLSGFLEFQKTGKKFGSWIFDPKNCPLTEKEAQELVTPEMICLFESMLAGQQYLLDRGVSSIYSLNIFSQMSLKILNNQVKEGIQILKDLLRFTPWEVSNHHISESKGKQVPFRDVYGKIGYIKQSKKSKQGIKKKKKKKMKKKFFILIFVSFWH
eukprot:Anaeramoba_flamelloidesa568026_52.p1 GENE.a568026_52~~a568026_52.p1  ORF type:complete len:729 (-),score=190.16 a568026_52:29-2215(-)